MGQNFCLHAQKIYASVGRRLDHQATVRNVSSFHRCVKGDWDIFRHQLDLFSKLTAVASNSPYSLEITQAEQILGTIT
jgi:hypothetical protein